MEDETDKYMYIKWYLNSYHTNTANGIQWDSECQFCWVLTAVTTNKL